MRSINLPLGAPRAAATAMLDLVIPDTGPLITLALVDRLDLLERFRCPILVTDMIHAELTRGLDTAPDRAAFERWYTATRRDSVFSVFRQRFG